ncbi:hypothetical protein B0O99DRAFT_747720 [Bisporella sp. PMI_857]|nr:hypothetical protein B0O99DRAFT_747720 [Bisporella sp. PMI_857]
MRSHFSRTILLIQGPHNENNSTQSPQNFEDRVAEFSANLLEIFDAIQEGTTADPLLFNSLFPTNINSEENSNHASAEGQVTNIDSLTRVTHFLSEGRKLDDYEDITKHAINRVSTLSTLACIPSRPFIEADYTISVEDLYHQVAYRILSRSNNLDLFCEVEHDTAVQDDPENNLKNLAVLWVLRWDCPSRSCSLGQMLPDTKKVKDGFAASWVRISNAVHAAAQQDSAVQTHLQNFAMNFLPVEEYEEAAKTGNEKAFLSMADAVRCNRKVFHTSNGLLGVGPAILKPGDVVCILPHKVPFVLRKVEHGPYRLVGACYVDGIMDGEKMDEPRLEFQINGAE